MRVGAESASVKSDISKSEANISRGYSITLAYLRLSSLTEVRHKYDSVTSHAVLRSQSAVGQQNSGSIGDKVLSRRSKYLHKRVYYIRNIVR